VKGDLMGKKENIVDTIRTNETLNKLFRKADKLDHIMMKAGKEPVMRKAVNKTIKPFCIDGHEAWKIERMFTRLLEVFKKHG
jgi:hypothetical protein